MNMINFHTYPKNKKYIEENDISYCGQGLVNSYWVMPIGNGWNRYIFTVEFKSKIHKIIVEERHILAWKIRTEGEDEEDKPEDNLEFNALGKIEESGLYVSLRTHDCDDFTYLNNRLKVIDIMIENMFPHYPFITVSHENEYIRKISVPRQKEYDDALKIGPNLDCAKIEYDELFDAKNWNKRMYFVIDDKKSWIIPFEILSIKHSDDHTDDSMDARIYYKWRVCNENIKLYYEQEIEDRYNISIRKKIQFDEWDEEISDEFFEYCYIVG